MQVRFWGTRGSIPKCGPQILRYGGSTPCIEVLTDAGTLIVIDCGSGGHGLGQSLQGAGRGHRGHLLISHTHWDHIQGLPFFTPFFVPGNQWEIYAPRGVRQSLEETLAGQMQSTYFPVELEELGAKIHFHELVEGDLQIEEVRIATCYLNHPALTWLPACGGWCSARPRLRPRTTSARARCWARDGHRTGSAACRAPYERGPSDPRRPVHTH